MKPHNPAATQRAFQPTLDKAYRASSTEPLPFDFGYNFSDKRDNRSNILVGRKSSGVQTQHNDTKQSAVLRTAAKFPR